MEASTFDLMMQCANFAVDQYDYMDDSGVEEPYNLAICMNLEGEGLWV